MTRIAYFAHNIEDAAIRRRAATLQAIGCEVTTYSMRRGDAVDTPWANVDLGRTHDGQFAQRLAAAAAAFPKLMAHRLALQSADLWIARNLDMAALAAGARAATGAQAPLLYECLDIHRFMTRKDALGAAMRALENGVLSASSGVVVSSSGFVENYFVPQFGAASKMVLIENRLAYGLALPPRPQMLAPRPDRPLTIGWFGNLRCRRSLALMRSISRLPNVRVVLRGYPALTEIPDFDAQVAAEPGMAFGGRYAYPHGLAEIYGAVDLIWAGDFHDADANSAWLLPNRLYEGGYFGVPPIAPAGSQTGRWLAEHNLGFALDEPLEETLPAFIASMTTERLQDARRALLDAPQALFLQSRDEAASLVERFTRRAVEPTLQAA
jgi:succinoglycan biosynthesis protein ExoL